MTEAAKDETQPAEVPVAKIVTTKVRETYVTLEYPVEYDGVLYEKIKVRRVTGKEIAEYFDSLGTGTGQFIPPMIECPQAVWDAMDDDDQNAVDKAAEPFTPRRLKAAVELAEGIGGNTSV